MTSRDVNVKSILPDLTVLGAGYFQNIWNDPNSRCKCEGHSN